MSLARTLTTALVALTLSLSAGAAMAERQPHRGGIFQVFKKNPAAAAERAAKRAERKAERAALRKGAEPQDKARAEVKAKVVIATANRPKGRIWCVPFARMVTGVDLRGNAKTWWKQAAGIYERGNEPKVGAVMNFAGSRSMPMGHVAVVSKIVSDREILVDQANWERNKITEDTLVVDVSAAGDWSEVRVANAAGTLGRENPVYGFIYN